MIKLLVQQAFDEIVILIR